MSNQATASAASAQAAFLKACAFVTKWSIWFGKLVVAIGIAYAAARIFSIGWLSIEGFRLPYPKVAADAQQLAWLAGTIWLITR